MRFSLIYINMASVLTFSCLRLSATEIVNSSAEFVATKEWQVIPEGQAIPQGLHVRINLQTGLKEAKLLDSSDGDTAVQTQPSDKEFEKTNEPLSLDYKTDMIEESVRKAKDHRSYTELRKAYKDFQKNFRTDGELIVQLIEQYRNFSKTHLDSDIRSKLNALENLEYLLHQIDNALVFIDNGGLDDVLLPIVVNDTNTDLRTSAIRVLGALTGNNPKAQIKVFERNFGSHLSQILKTSKNNAEISSALNAFGALLRKFPMVQQRILSTSGTQAVMSVLRSPEVELRNKAKVVSLISDLMLERRHVLDAGKDSADADPAVGQYVLLEFESWLQSQDYCVAVETVLSKDFAQLLDQPDVAEQFVVGMETTEALCRTLWPLSPTLRHALLTLRNRFSNSEDEYRVEVAQALSALCERLYDKHSHTEL